MASKSKQRKLEDYIKDELGTHKWKSIGYAAGGCINEGQSFDTDQGKIFVKFNTKAEARRMFDGEYTSLNAMLETNTIHVPKPIKVLDHPCGSGAVLVMEHVDMGGLRRYQAQLGEQLARLHLENIIKLKKAENESSRVGGSNSEGYVEEFGFHTTTCCGYLPQNNSWHNDWLEFFTRQRLQCQLDLIEKEYHDAEARTLWSRLQQKLPELFKGVEIKPSLLHGDLWGGNVAENDCGPVIFDPASYYGHHEFELAIAGMFGGFSSAFYEEYHRLIPKAPGFNNRHELYKLFHYLNHCFRQATKRSASPGENFSALGTPSPLTNLKQIFETRSPTTPPHLFLD